MRSISEHIKTLPADIAEKAAHNILDLNEDPERVLSSIAYSLQDALILAFDWDKSPQGFVYWQRISGGKRVTPRVTL